MFSFISKSISLKNIEGAYFRDNKVNIQAANLVIAKLVALCASVAYWIMYILSFFLWEISECSVVYLPAAVSMTLVSIYLVFFKKNSSHSIIIVYLEIFVMAAAAITLDTYFSENYIAGLYIGLAVIFSVIIIDKVWRVLLFNLLINTIFIVLCFYFKSADTAIIDLINIVITVLLGHCLFRFCMNLIIQNFNALQSSKNSEKKEQQMQLLLSQIQPHFMFNALTTIQYLCKSDPNTASVTTNRFAKYIRVNMNSLKKMEPVPFENEINHVKNYLYIEQLRYGERLTVEYDLQAKDFEIPMITIQPLVENAIRHGIAKNEHGGKVRISSLEDLHYYVIKVEDDGKGFDVRKYSILEEDVNKIGLANIRKRLGYMCKGTLSVESKEGSGTTAIICIPKGGN